MVQVSQNMKLETEPITLDEIQVKIPSRGKIKPSKVKKGISGLPRIIPIQIFSTTNYAPGRITFKQNEE